MIKYCSFLLFKLLTFLTIVHLPLSAQEFITHLIFEDAAGNRDTVIIGYDERATYGVDPKLGEKNILGKGFDSDFDVRITNELEMRACHPDSTGTYHLKKQIVPYLCAIESVIPINIKCDHWPVKVYWEKEQFDTQCLEGSLLISSVYKEYSNVFGIDGLHGLRLAGNSSVLLKHSEIMRAPETYSFLNSNEELIHGIWIALGNEDLLVRALKTEVKLVEIIENPEQGQILCYPFLNIPTYLSLYSLHGDSKVERLLTEKSNDINYSLPGSGGAFLLYFRNIFMEYKVKRFLIKQ